MDPDDVGHLVLEAVLNDRFWVMTHPEMLRGVELQTAAMLNEQRLTKG